MIPPSVPASWRFPAGTGVFFLRKGRVWPALPAWPSHGAQDTGVHSPCPNVTHRLHLADSGLFPRQNPGTPTRQGSTVGHREVRRLDVLQYVIHVKEHFVHEERKDGASPARRTRERRWRAGSAMVAGMLALAVGSGGCATIIPEHKIATHGSTLQGSGNSEGGTGSLGKLNSALNGKDSKANAGTLAGVGNGVMFGGDVPLAPE